METVREAFDATIDNLHVVKIKSIRWRWFGKGQGAGGRVRRVYGGSIPPASALIADQTRTKFLKK